MYRRSPATLLLVGAAVLGASLAQARTLTVAKDGTGQYAVIQAAVNQAAPGDTIRITPGQYAEMAPLVMPGWTENVCVAIQTDNLTLIGAGADLTRIGPSLPQKEPMPKGIAAISVSDLAVIGLTIENIREGIYQSQGHVTLRDCILNNCVGGVVAWTEGGMLVEDCQFVGNTGDGIVTFSPSRSILISNCTFRDNSYGVDFANGTTDAIVENCRFQGGIVGAQIANGSSGAILDCTFGDVANVAIGVGIGSVALLMNNSVFGGQTNLDIETNCSVSGSGNEFRGGSYATIVNGSSPNMNLHGNHILHSGGYSLYVGGFVYDPAVTLDLSNNYWGTTDANQIAEWIRDGNDNPKVRAFVTYQPFAGGPVGTEARSWGEVKVLYGR